MDFSKAITKLNFSDEADSLAFEQELASLLNQTGMALLVQNNTIPTLHALYLKLVSAKNAMQLAMEKMTGQSNHAACLSEYFQALLTTKYALPKKSLALEVFVSLCSKSLEKTYLQKLLKTGILDELPVPQLQKLEHFYTVNLEALIDFHADHAAAFSTAEIELVLDLLYLLYPTTIYENTPAHVAYYLKNVLPLFVDRFAHRMDQAEIFSHTDRIAEWFMVWQRHHLKLEEGLDDDDEYYQTDFSTIIKYITEFIWWNNGLYFQSGDKDFYFGSPGFRHLALGGSIRNAPNLHPFTRRMAKVFVTLPYDFDQTEKDMYIYCYNKAIGAGPLLLELLQEFMRHPSNPVELQAELDRWHPVIQKLSTEDFEQITPHEARQLLGYIYHCLRDQPGFSVQRRRLIYLLRDSQDYYQRIQERENARRVREEALQQLRRKEEKKALNFWKPHPTIKPMKFENHKIIELLSKPELHREGSVMNHCVGSYARRCLAGYCTIWSLRKLRKERWYSLVTIEVDKSRRIVQMSASFNAIPSREHRNMIEKWAQREGISM